MSSRRDAVLYYSDGELAVIRFMMVLLAGGFGMVTGLAFGAAVRAVWMFMASVSSAVDPISTSVVEPMLWGSMIAFALLSMKVSVAGLSDRYLPPYS